MVLAYGELTILNTQYSVIPVAFCAGIHMAQCCRVA